MTEPGSEAALHDKLFVLTGPTSGLGLCLLEHLCSRGAVVLGIGRDTSRVAAPGRFLIDCDLAEPLTAAWLGTFTSQFRAWIDQYPGRTLVFISNAGMIAPIIPAALLDDEALRRAMAINCIAPTMLASAMIDAAGARSLRIVNISTGAARRPIAGWLAYCASKAAGKMALDVLATENSHVVVIHIDPGVMDTAMQTYIRAQGSPAAGTASQLKPVADAAREILAVALGAVR